MSSEIENAETAPAETLSRELLTELTELATELKAFERNDFWFHRTETHNGQDVGVIRTVGGSLIFDHVYPDWPGHIAARNFVVHAHNFFPALLSMAARTLDAEQKLAEAQRDQAEAEKTAQAAVQGQREAVKELLERVQKAEGERDALRGEAIQVVLQNMASVARAQRAEAEVRRLAQELDEWEGLELPEGSRLRKTGSFRDDTVLPPPPLCQCPTGLDGVRSIDETCPVCMSEGEG